MGNAGGQQQKAAAAGGGDAEAERRSVALLRAGSAVLRELVEEMGVPDEAAVDLVHEFRGDELEIMRAVARHVNEEDPESHIAGQARSSRLADKFRRSIHAKEINAVRKLGFSDVNTLRALRETGYSELEAIKLLLKEHHRHSLVHRSSSFSERLWSSGDSKDESKGHGALKIDQDSDASSPAASPATLHSPDEAMDEAFGSPPPADAAHKEGAPDRVVMGIRVPEPVILERRAHDADMLRALKGQSSVKWNPALVRAMVAMKRKADDAKETVRQRESPPEDVIQVRRGNSQINLLQERLKNFGMSEIVVSGDGNCQFRAISHELFKTQEHHSWVRKKAVARMRDHHDEYVIFFDGQEDFEAYVARMATLGEWGDELTLKAIADALGVTVHVLTSTEGFGGYYLEYAPANENAGDCAAANEGSENSSATKKDANDPPAAARPVRRNVFLTYLSPVHYNVMTMREDERRKRLSDRARALLSQADDQKKSFIMQVPSASLPACPADVPKEL